MAVIGYLLTSFMFEDFWGKKLGQCILLAFLSDGVLFPNPERVLEEAKEVSKKWCF